MTVVLYLFISPVYISELREFLTWFESRGTQTWKIKELIGHHPGTFCVMAESKMAAIDRSKNPNLCVFDNIFICNTSNLTDFDVLSSFLVLFFSIWGYLGESNMAATVRSENPNICVFDNDIHLWHIYSIWIWCAEFISGIIVSIWGHLDLPMSR